MLSVHHSLAATALLAALATPLVAQQPDSTARDSSARDTITLRPVVITARAVDRRFPAYTRSTTKTDRALRDVPQAVTVLSGDLIAEQAMQNMADLVRYVPGVSMGQGEGHRDAPTIRGNSSTADFFVDGVRDDAQYLRDLYNVERVEALRGSNAMVFGRGGGGGIINRVTKEATLGAAPRRAVTFAGGSHDHKRTSLDVGESLGRSFAVRVNGVLENSAFFRAATTLDRRGINPTVAIRLDSVTDIHVDYEHFDDHRTVNRGIPSWQGRPSPAPIATFFGDPNASSSRIGVDAVGATFQRGTASGIRIRNRIRFATYDKFYQNVYPGGAVNAAGTTVNLAAYYQDIGRTNLFNQTDLTYAIATPGGRLKQTFLVGAELGRQASTNYRATGYFNDSLTQTSYPVPFNAPMVTAPVTFRQSTSDANNESRAIVAALYAQDEVTLGAHWQAVAGIRYDRFDLSFHNNRDGQELRRVDNVFSPRAGLVFKPAPAVSLYGSYSASFLPSSGDQFSALSVTSSTLEPERFTNREAGIKWDVRPNLSLSCALYLLDRTNTTAPNPADPAGRVVQTGRTRSKGFEAGLAGTITDHWHVTGGVAIQRARIASTTTVAPAGAVVPLVPNTTLSLWNRYQVTEWLGGGLGVIHQADMYAAIDNTVTLPSFTRVDLAAFVALGRNLDIQVNIENLLDTRYYATSHGNNNIMPGAPRTLRVGVTATP